MREQARFSVVADEAIDAALRDMVAKEAPPMLKSRVLARLGDEAIDATLGNIAAQEVPSTLRGRVMARIEEESTRADRAPEERWTLVRPLLRPAFGLAAAGLVSATALAVWLLRTPPLPGQEGTGGGQVASQLQGTGGAPSPGAHVPAQSKGGVNDREPSPSVATGTAATRASRSTTSARTIPAARHRMALSGAESEDTGGAADDPLAIRQLKVDPLSVSAIAIRPIEVTPVEIVPPMSDAAPNPPGESDAESRTGR